MDNDADGAEELRALPMNGRARDRLKATADGSVGAGNIGDQGSNHDINTLATALVAVRTGDPAYWIKTVEALISIINSGERPDSHYEFTRNKARSLAITRNFTAYIIAADPLISAPVPIMAKIPSGAIA